MRTEALETFVQCVFVKLGIAEDPARLVAAALVEADLEGIASHGVMLLPMYVDRMMAGSVSKAVEGKVVHDAGPAIVIDAGHALGQLTSDQATRLAVARARTHGIDRKSTRLNSSHIQKSRMPSSA